MPEPQPNPEPTPSSPEPPKDPVAPKPDPEPSPEPTILESAKPVMVNPDGTFHKDWRTMLPEDLREEEALKLYKDVPGLAKAMVNAKKVVGRDKVVVPNEKSKPEEWGAFYDAIGRPKTAGDYKFDVPEDLKGIFTDERMNSARELAHKLGITSQQFEAYMQHEMESAVKLLEVHDREEAEARQRAKQDAEDALRKEFGGAYDERILVAKRIVAEAFPNEEQRMDFLQEFGSNPKFVRFASILGARLSESKAIVAELRQETPKEAHKKIQELQNTPGYLAPYRKDGKMVEMSNEERQGINEQIREYYKQIYPEAEKHNALVG